MKSLADRAIACALAATTLAVCLYFSPRGVHLGFVDMGHDGYQLQQALDLSRGGVIFRDTFDQYGPLNGYVNTIGFVAFGRRLLAMKYFVSIWYAFTAVALFAMARHWLDRWLSAFTVLLWLAVAPFYGHGIMISPHAYVLLLQTLATIVLLRAGGDVGVRRYALVGLLAGLCWALKQSMGVLYLMAVLSYLTIQVGLAPSEWRRIAKAATSASVAFFAVVGVSLGCLWSVGALSDWYLQTLAFPREFYLARTSISGPVPSGVWGRAIDAAAAFISLQRTESLFWIVIRGVVFLAAAVQIMRRTASDTILIALITAFLWLAAYPSANFMHQW